jgi:hypothetical protein
MIPMRDGVRLQTVLLTPKNAKGPLPFLIDRTPYGVPEKEATEKGCRRGSDGAARTTFSSRRTSAGASRARASSSCSGRRTTPRTRSRRGRDHGRLGYGGVAGEERAEQQRAGGDRGDILRRVDRRDGGAEPASGAKAAIEQASPADQFLGDDFHHNGAFRLSYGFEYSAMLETSATENYRFQFDRGGYLRLVSRAGSAGQRG